METNPFISVISPVYMAATILPELVERINRAITPLSDNFEIILVEDCSPDNSWQTIQSLLPLYPNLKGIRLSRNFGQQSAIHAGMDVAKGDWIVTLDCDLQDKPEVIPQMIQKASDENLDMVFAARQNRQDGVIKKVTSKAFYKLVKLLSDTPVDPNVANFVVYSRRAIEAMKNVGDFYRYYPMINRWIGFNTATVKVEHSARSDDRKSSYSFKKRFVLAVHTILSFSDKPLRLVLSLGVSIVLFSVIIAIALIIRYFVVGVTVSGWLSIFMSIWLLSGIIIMVLGIIGLYIGKTFETVKKRPTYIIKEKIGNNTTHE